MKIIQPVLCRTVRKDSNSSDSACPRDPLVGHSKGIRELGKEHDQQGKINKGLLLLTKLAIIRQTTYGLLA